LQAKTVLRLALRSIQRFDLDEWILNQSIGSHHKTFQEVEKEIQKHSRNSSEQIHFTKQDDNNSSFILQLFWILIGLGVIIVISLIFLVISFSKRKEFTKTGSGKVKINGVSYREASLSHEVER
jgi:hypothetical protein